MVYNVLDQVVATQDAYQRVNNQWMFTKYDALGRVTWTGLWNNNNTPIDQPTLQGVLNGITTNLWESRAAGSNYTNNAWPNTNLTYVLTVNYYDDYTFPGLPSNFTPPTGNSSMTKGLLTASQTNVLGSTDMLWTVHYYDDNARVIQSYQQHYLGGVASTANYDIVSNTYDFTGEIINTTRKHFNTTSASPIVTIANSYNYDHMGRKLQTYEQINGGANVLLSKTDYNEVGQVMGKHLHSEDNGSTFLQNVGYLYNERGWMLSSLTNQNGTPTNLFNLYLRYNNNIQNTATLQQFNGNIAEMQYAGQGAGKTFDYTYDQLNRLLIASSGGTLDETLPMITWGISTVCYVPAGQTRLTWAIHMQMLMVI